MSRQHRMAMNLLVYGLSNRSLFSVVSGDIGTGKTTILRYLLKRRGPQLSVGVITGVSGTFIELLQWTLFEFGLDHAGLDKIGMQQLLVEFVKREELKGRRMVLVIDEAQALAPEVLEELRLFSNVSIGSVPLLQIVLVGQLGLRATLRLPEMRQFAQRVGVDYVIAPLDREQTHEYIRHRLSLAGREQANLFTPEACDSIFTVSAEPSASSVRRNAVMSSTTSPPASAVSTMSYKQGAGSLPQKAGSGCLYFTSSTMMGLRSLSGLACVALW